MYTQSSEASTDVFSSCLVEAHEILRLQGQVAVRIDVLMWKSSRLNPCPLVVGIFASFALAPSTGSTPACLVAAFQVSTTARRKSCATSRERNQGRFQPWWDVTAATGQTAAVTLVLSATTLPHQQPRPSTGKDEVHRAKRGRRLQQEPPDDDWTSRPLRRDEVVRRARELDRTELVVGRVAMVGATLLLIKEVVTGESILEQVNEVLSRLVS